MACMRCGLKYYETLLHTCCSVPAAAGTRLLSAAGEVACGQRCSDAGEASPQWLLLGAIQRIVENVASFKDWNYVTYCNTAGVLRCDVM